MAEARHGPAAAGEAARLLRSVLAAFERGELGAALRGGVALLRCIEGAMLALEALEALEALAAR